MRIKFRVQKAFTLIELFVVIAIIGTLAALLLPALSMAKAHTHSATCKNRLRQIGSALQMYVHDHESKYPYFVNPYDPSLDDAVGPVNTRYWWAKLQPYYPLKWTNAAYHCPGYKGLNAGELSPHAPLGSYAYNEHGVAIPGGGYIDASRGINIHFTNWFGLGPAYHKTSPLQAVSETQIMVPSEMFAVGESRFLDPGLNVLPGGNCDMICGWIKSSHAVDQLHRCQYAFDPRRHGKKYNQYFCDGHVSSMNPWILFNPTNTAAMWNYDHQPHPELWIPD